MKVLAIPDTHFPWCSKKSLAKIIVAIKKEKPDAIVQLGDLYDQYTFSKYSRSMDLITPKKEIELARKQATQMWVDIKKAAPKAKCYQLFGNHDDRMIKRVLEKLPELGDLFDIRKHFYLFDGVETLKSSRDVLKLDGVYYTHGYLTNLGAHIGHIGGSVVHGHSHRPGIAYARTPKSFVFEMDCGHLALEDSLPLSYTPIKMKKWLHAYGIVENGMPRLVIL